MRLSRLLGLVLVLGTFASLLAMAEQGPFADQIVYDVRMQEEIAIQDVAAGNSDVFLYGSSGNVINGLDQATLDKLELYVSPGLYFAFPLNPYPNEAPYIATDIDDGTQTFNPFAINEVRFQMHNLLNRTVFANDILQGAGEGTILSVSPNSPGAFKLYLEASKLGLSVTGDRQLAYDRILAAIEAAATLPAMGGRLTKLNDATAQNPGNWWWAFDGQPVTLKFWIRVDDPNIRVPLGQYFANEIEYCHLKVDRILRNRAACIPTVYQTDPARMEWHTYTEAWGGGGVNKWWESSIAQYYSGWYTGDYPGWVDPVNWWHFTNPVSEEVTKKLIYGQFQTMDEYWSLMQTACREGLKDSVRIYVGGQLGYFCANKDAFESRFLYGNGVGLNWSSMYTMIPVNKDRPVRLTQLAAQGGMLFLNPWDPVGTEGFNDNYASFIDNVLTDQPAQNAMGSAVETGLWCKWSDVSVGIDWSNPAAPAGTIAVPDNAVEYRSGTKTWVQVNTDAADKNSWCKATYTYTLYPWHDGTMMSLLDIAAAEGFITEWATNDGAGDTRYDAGLDSGYTPTFVYSHGSVYDWANSKIVAYFDTNFPDNNRVANTGVPLPFIRGGNFGQGVKWVICEALGLIVSSGVSASGTVYGFTLNPGIIEPDILTPSCVADVRAKLVEMRDSKYVPDYLAAILPAAGKTAADLAAEYDAAIKFIDKYGHAYIGNGGYILTKFDAANAQITVDANRDPKYPFTGQGWYDLFSVGEARINEIVVPFVAAAGQDTTVAVKVDEGTFPFDVFEPATTVAVQLILVGPSGETTLNAVLATAGEYTAVIPGSATAGFPAGGYTVVALATPGDGLPVSLSATLLIQ